MTNNFPRLKEFKFGVYKTYKVPVNFVGRLDLIAFEQYGNPLFYKVLAAANNIRTSIGVRYGVRSTEESLFREFKQTGKYSDEEIYFLIKEKLFNTIGSTYDWNEYTNTSYGYISEVYEGRVLTIPPIDDANRWMQLYAGLVR